MPLSTSDTFAQSVRSVNERLTRIEATMDGDAITRGLVQQHATDYRTGMQKDIDELKAKHVSLHDKIDAGFREIKTMIEVDRKRSIAQDGAIALARWLIGIMAAVSGAVVASVAYWLSYRK